MEKEILTLIIGSFLVFSCSNSPKLNNEYGKDENKIIYDFIASQKPQDGKMFIMSVDNPLGEPTRIMISRSDMPLYPIFDFTIDSINGNLVVFESENPRKEESYYSEYIDKGYVIIDNMHHESFNADEWYIIYCPESKKQEMYTSEEYYKVTNGSEVKFLEDFCN